MADVTFITLEKVLEMKANGKEFTLLDVLSEDDFNEGHIPGATNIPSEKIVAEAQKSVPRDRPVVTYCAGYECTASTIAARKLQDVGYSDVLDFKGGLQVWSNAGFELES